MIRNTTPRHRVGATACLSIALVVLLAQMGHASEWQSVLDTPDGIEIYRKASGADGLIEFRGVGVIEAPMPLVATVIFDTDRRREWIKGLAESRILHWEGKDRFVEYDHIDMPLFFSDRDFVSAVSIRIDRSGKSFIFRYQASDDPAAPRTDYIRGKVLNMTFQLQSLDDGKRTRVDAEFLCDPKGWIPSLLVNYFLEDWPKVTFRNLRKEVLKPDISIDRRLSDLLQPGRVSLNERLIVDRPTL
jgi:hypothetical protein